MLVRSMPSVLCILGERIEPSDCFYGSACVIAERKLSFNPPQQYRSFFQLCPTLPVSQYYEMSYQMDELNIQSFRCASAAFWLQYLAKCWLTDFPSMSIQAHLPRQWCEEVSCDRKGPRNGYKKPQHSHSFHQQIVVYCAPTWIIRTFQVTCFTNINTAFAEHQKSPEWIRIRKHTMLSGADSYTACGAMAPGPLHVDPPVCSIS